MKTAKIKFSEFQTASNGSFGSDANAVKDAVYVNNIATFPSPPITKAQFEDEIAEYIRLNSLCDSDNGSHTDRTDRETQREIVYGSLVAIGLYILSVAATRETYNEQKGIVELAAYPVANDTNNPVVP